MLAHADVRACGCARMRADVREHVRMCEDARGCAHANYVITLATECCASLDSAWYLQSGAMQCVASREQCKSAKAIQRGSVLKRDAAGFDPEVLRGPVQNSIDATASAMAQQRQYMRNAVARLARQRRH